ncbi:MAG: phage tail assembly protein [Serratia symbiotica]|nr:phage tail assembly protein [Serratia symbiotica]
MQEKQTTDGANLATNQPITLDVPIVRGTTQITAVTINKPNAGALRGTRLQALIETDVDSLIRVLPRSLIRVLPRSLIRVLPRITTPNLTAAEVANLDPADLYQLSQAVAIFFLPNAVRSDFLNS